MRKCTRKGGQPSSPTDGAELPRRLIRHLRRCVHVVGYPRWPFLKPLSSAGTQRVSAPCSPRRGWNRCDREAAHRLVQNLTQRLLAHRLLRPARARLFRLLPYYLGRGVVVDAATPCYNGLGSTSQHPEVAALELLEVLAARLQRRNGEVLSVRAPRAHGGGLRTRLNFFATMSKAVRFFSASAFSAAATRPANRPR